LNNTIDVIRMTVLELRRRRRIWAMQCHFLQLKIWRDQMV